MISSTRAEVKPIIAARPFTRSATARKSLGRSIGVSIGDLKVDDEALLEILFVLTTGLLIDARMRVLISE